MKQFLSIVAAVVVILIGTTFIVSKNAGEPSANLQGGLVSANQATSTDDWGPVAVSGFKVIKGTAGVLSGVIINNVSAGSFTLYNGTTTNHGDYATSSVWHYNVYPNMPSTSVLDISFSKGLIAVFNSTNLASSTILYQ